MSQLRNHVLPIFTIFGLLSSAQAQSTFTGLGYLPGGGMTSFAYGISADGTTVVGKSVSSGAYEAFVWTSGGGMVGQGDLPGGSFTSEAYAVSGTGASYVGFGSVSSGAEAMRNMVGIGDLPGGLDDSFAYGVSGDGAKVVGLSYSVNGLEAFLWTGSMIGLGDLAGGGFASQANAISSDGRIVVGWGTSAAGQEAFYFDSSILSGTMTGIGDLPGGGFNSIAHACSSDGSVIVGESDSGQGVNEGFRWTLATGMVAIGGHQALACSGDGSVIVGKTYGAYSSATIWDAAHGTRVLEDVLTWEYGLGASIAGWDLLEATGISADGTWITGNAYDPSGYPQAWLAHLGPGAMTPYCFGDGASVSLCPCSNQSPVGDQSGCLNSTGMGGKLTGSGIASVGADTVVLHGSQMPPSASALYLQGSNTDGGFYGTGLGDGKRCILGPVIRLGTKINSGGASSFGAGSDPHVSVKGLVAPGATKHYQIYYRNLAPYCTSETFNLTNGLTIVWGL